MVVSKEQRDQSPRSPLNRRQKKSDEINSHLVRVLDKILDDLELFLAAACALVGRDGITRHAFVDPAGTIVASYIGNAWDRRAILASRGVFVKRDVAASTYEYAWRLV